MRGHDAILVFVYGLTRMVHFAPSTTDVDDEERGRLFFWACVLPPWYATMCSLTLRCTMALRLTSHLPFTHRQMA